MTTNGAIRTEEVTNCFLCETKGTPIYEGLRDRVFGASGFWNFLQCSKCGLVWLSPRPVPEDISKIYTTYYTHVEGRKRSRLAVARRKVGRAVIASVSDYNNLASGWGWSMLGSALSLVPPLREAARLATMCLSGVRKGKILDIGCGNGHFLSLMRDAGWDVLGLDNDPAAATQAQQEFGIPVIVGTLQQAAFPKESFDAITLRHVIEHVYNPIELLSMCRQILKPQGKLVAVTPNVESQGHRVFQEFWRGLEPPRHLFLFSVSTLKDCVAKSGLQIQELRSTARTAGRLWAISQVLKTKGAFSLSDLSWPLLLRGLAFQIREELALRNSKEIGEELLVIAS